MSDDYDFWYIVANSYHLESFFENDQNDENLSVRNQNCPTKQPIIIISGTHKLKILMDRKRDVFLILGAIHSDFFSEIEKDETYALNIFRSTTEEESVTPRFINQTPKCNKVDLQS